VEVTSAPVSAGNTPRLVTIRSHPELGPNTREHQVVEMAVEPTLLWPLIKGSDVQPWRIRDSGLYAIVAHDPDNLRRVLREDDLMRVSGKLFDYFEPHLAQLGTRSLYRSRELEPGDGPWGWSGPLEHLDASAHVVLVRYIASGARPAAAVAFPQLDPLLGRRTVPLPNNKNNVYFTKSEDEALYLAGWINAAPVQDALQRFSAATGITPRALERIPIPGYDDSNPQHRETARLAAICVRAAADDDRAALLNAWKHLDHVVARIAGVDSTAMTQRSGGEISQELELIAEADPI
jgi:hypothetical protein